MWQDNDKIQVISSQGGPNEFSLSSGASSKQGKFTGTRPGGTPLYAVFGASNISIESSNLKFEVAGSRIDYPVGNIASNGIPAVSKVGEDGAVGLRNVFGLLRLDFTFTGTDITDIPPIKKIVLHDLAGNPLWGTCSVPIKDNGDLNYENATVTNTAGDANSISVEFSDAQSLSGQKVYFPVPANALDGGFSVVLYDETGAAYSFLQKITSPVAVPRSSIVAVSANVTPKSEPLDVKGRGYYKSLFVNAGVSLDGFRHKDDDRPDDDIPAIEYMGLDEDFEHINLSNKDTQNGIIIGNDRDANGVLLYPDGSPRFRLIFNRGGSSVKHGTSLGANGRGRFKTFFENGGSYSGVCAGSFLAATTVSDATIETDDEEDFTFQLIPVTLTHTNLPVSMKAYKGIYTNMKIFEDANDIISNLNGDGEFDELLNGSIKDVMHHGGGYLPKSQWSVSGIEKLMTYQYSDTHGSSEQNPDDGQTYDAHYYREDNLDKILFRKNNAPIYRVDTVSTWAYKSTTDKTSGRAVCTGSHPEVPGNDSDTQFTGFMFRYAMEGNGDAIVKNDDLILGQTRYMNQIPTVFTEPASNNAGIGDGQYHHFKFETTGDTENFVLRLDSACDSSSGIDLYLGLRKQKSTNKTDFAWLSDADYTLCNKGGQKEIRIKNLPKGTWYVSVYCATKVTATQGTGSWTYSGKTEVLNGVPYSISIAQDGSIKEFFPSAFGGDGDDFANTMDD